MSSIFGTFCQKYKRVRCEQKEQRTNILKCKKSIWAYFVFSEFCKNVRQGLALNSYVEKCFLLVWTNIKEMLYDCEWDFGKRRSPSKWLTLTMTGIVRCTRVSVYTWR